MKKVKKVLGLTLLAVVVFFGLVIGKWYRTVTSEPIHPQRGVYGMDGMEVWIDINARMPNFAREWGCYTLRKREAVVLGGQNTIAPHSCQKDFATAVSQSGYETIISGNIAQYSAGLNDQQAQALRACFDTKMAAEVTAEEIAAVNDRMVGDAAKKIILAANRTIRACKAEVAP